MILIAIGANLPTFQGVSPRLTCEHVVHDVARLPGIRHVATSQWYHSAAMPPSGQAPYVNGVVRLEGDAEPAALLLALHTLEAGRGRERSVANAARTLDLDLIAMDGIVRTAPDPVLPHPRMHERAFVLLPLLDVAPDWVHPVLGVSAAALLAGLPPQGVYALPPLRRGGRPPN